MTRFYHDSILRRGKITVVALRKSAMTLIKRAGDAPGRANCVTSACSPR